jgi:hypothetical protein
MKSPIPAKNNTKGTISEPPRSPRPILIRVAELEKLLHAHPLYPCFFALSFPATILS